MAQQPEAHFTLWKLGRQPVDVTFDGGQIVSDTGLLAVRALEKPLGVIAGLAQRLPDPRSPKYIEHSVEALLTQAVYQVLAGYPDYNDAQELRQDPLFQILADDTHGDRRSDRRTVHEFLHVDARIRIGAQRAAQFLEQPLIQLCA